MRTIFEGADRLICQALRFEEKQSLKQKSSCAALVSFAELERDIQTLIQSLDTNIANQWNGRIPSPMNWKLRRQTSIQSHNASPEILLERAIAILAARELLPEWYNQLPIASGLLDETSDKRAAVDLVKITNNHATLIELKWASDTPVYAAFEIIRYGLAYLFSRKMQEGFGYGSYPLMQVDGIALRVLAPHSYYSPYDLGFLQDALNLAVQSHFSESMGLSCSFQFVEFPASFSLPFHSGAEVLALQDAPKNSPAVSTLLEAIRHIQPVWGSA